MSNTATSVLNLCIAALLAGSIVVGYLLVAHQPPSVEPPSDGSGGGIPPQPEILRIHPKYPETSPGHAITDRLTEDLLSRSDLIPFDGVLGGSMRFHTADNIYPLSERWIFARFDDGHISGGMLLEYRVTSSLDIQWRVIEARLD